MTPTLFVYQTEDERTRIDCRFERRHALAHAKRAVKVPRGRGACNAKHVRNILDFVELVEAVTVSISEAVAADGSPNAPPHQLKTIEPFFRAFPSSTF